MRKPDEPEREAHHGRKGQIDDELGKEEVRYALARIHQCLHGSRYIGFAREADQSFAQRLVFQQDEHQQDEHDGELTDGAPNKRK